MVRMLLARLRRPGAALTAVALLTTGLALAPGGAARGGDAPASSVEPSPSAPVVGTRGARSLGDPFYPTLGNGGYDTTAIDLRVTWSVPERRFPDGRAVVRTTLDAITTQDLSALTLDLAPGSTTVTGVTVDGLPAAHRMDAIDRKLEVELPEPLAAGTPFQVQVDSTAVPGPVSRTGEDGGFERPGEDPDEVRVREGRGLIADGHGGMLLAAQPNGAHTLFPVNDHPLDKATIRVTLTVPPGMLGVASGALAGMSVGQDGSLTTSWSSSRPTASHVLAIGVGDYVLRSGPATDAVTYRSAIPPDVESGADTLQAELPGLVEWLTATIGVDHPFETFGLLAYDGRPTAAILEGQTLVLVPASVFSPLVDRCRSRGTIVHEAAHQWFGNLASIARWDQKWLSEGHATYYEWRWLAEHDCLPVDGAPGSEDEPDPGRSLGADPGTGPAADPAAVALDERMRAAYGAAASVRARYGPPNAIVDPAAAYTPAIYDQGALALYALRLEVGDRVFARLERAFLRRYADRAATTDQFIAVASRVARRDLRPFLGAWLTGSSVPPMPGRPGWTSVGPDASPPAATPRGAMPDAGTARPRRWSLRPRRGGRVAPQQPCGAQRRRGPQPTPTPPS